MPNWSSWCEIQKRDIATEGIQYSVLHCENIEKLNYLSFKIEGLQFHNCQKLRNKEGHNCLSRRKVLIDSFLKSNFKYFSLSHMLCDDFWEFICHLLFHQQLLYYICVASLIWLVGYWKYSQKESIQQNQEFPDIVTKHVVMSPVSTQRKTRITRVLSLHCKNLYWRSPCPTRVSDWSCWCVEVAEDWEGSCNLDQLVNLLRSWAINIT